MIVIGIDPGADGAYAAMDGNGQCLAAAVLPVVKVKRGTELDVDSFARTLEGYPADSLVVLEVVHAMPGQGVTSMFSFGRIYGEIIGTVKTMGLSLEMATPQAWKKVVLAGTDKSDGAQLAYCRRRWPGQSLLRTPKCTKPHEGIMDALCIAEYGRRTLLGDKP